jgi:N6-L-threonylcarbamoyladenine synthase
VRPLTLGIETSCDETSVAVTSARQVLSNVVTSSLHLHKKYGGVVPEIASRYHVEYIVEVADEALKIAGRKKTDIGLIAVTNGPGLAGALLTGISFGKSLSYALGVPVIGVNHVLAHLYSSFLNRSAAPEFPFIGLVVSGGHTALFYCKDIDKRKFLGTTQDDAVGEAYDKVAKILGLGYPGGPVIEKTARGSSGKAGIKFPKSYLGENSLDFSFSGIKTAVLYYVRKQRLIGPELVSDICFAFQEAALDSLVEKTVAAVARMKASSVVVGGGVAANNRLREKMAEAGKFNGFKISFPEFRYCLDNGAMIGVLGEEMYRRGYRSDLRLNAEPNLKI